MSLSKKVDKVSMSGSGCVHIPLSVSAVLALKNGVNIKSIPDEVLQRVNSIKVHVNSDEWKSVGGNNSNRTFSWRGGGSGSREGSSSSSSERHTYTHTHTHTNSSRTPGIPQKYVSKFKKPETNLEDKILNNIINGKLNTFSPANYEDVKQFLEQILDSGETGFLKDFMLLVFKKAAAEEIFCPHYAKLLSELSKSYSSLNDEMVKLEHAFMAIFEEVEETECKDYTAFLELNKQKLYRQGYSQFLAELCHHEVLQPKTLLDTLSVLFKQIKIHSTKDGKNKLIEEYCDCILRMTKIFQKKQGAYMNSLKGEVGAVIIPLVTEIFQNSASNSNPSISKKAKFCLMDVVDILRNA